MKKFIIIGFTLFLLSHEGFCQKSLLPYAGEYRAAQLRFKQIFSPSDYDDPTTYPIKNIDYQIIIDPKAKMIKFNNNRLQTKWAQFRLIGTPKFERFLDDKGDEVLMTNAVKARDTYGELCEIAFGIYTTAGVFRLVVDYPNKMFYSYEFVRSEDWDKYSH